MTSSNLAAVRRSEHPVVGISLKMYMSALRTRLWVSHLRSLVEAAENLHPTEVFVLPSFPLLESTGLLLAGSSISWGAQDIAASDDGAQTGEVGGTVLREVGCRYVEVGHSERRRLFGEDDVIVAAKVGQAFAHGLTPILCVGEGDRQTSDGAAEICVAQLESALGGHPDGDLIVAYEPVWAIGADHPAAPEHVREVCTALRQHLSSRPGRVRLLYGGSAGPGTYVDLAPAVDGLFLGRFAHDTTNVAAVLQEIRALAQPEDQPLST